MKRYLLYIIMFAMVGPVMAQRERVDSLLRDSMFQTSVVGLEIYDLQSDSTLYSYNERQTLRPGSTMKCLTAITALDKLGGSYRYATTCLWDGTIVKRRDALGVKHKVFVGDITVRGGMDPLFGTDDMYSFVNTIKALDIDTIYGSVKGDFSFKDTLRLGRGWCWDDNNPCLTPLLWNRGDAFIPAFEEYLRGSGVAIVPASVVTSDSLYMVAVNKGKRVSAILDARYHTIDQVLIPMMKNSDNLYAETMLYQIAASSGVPYASAQIAIDTIKNLISTICKPKTYNLQPIRSKSSTKSTYNLSDGSGLSLYNYLSPELEVAFLRYAYHNKNIYNHLLPSLPVSGVDGTLQKRMTQSSCCGRVMAKTGTLTGVSSLAGYVMSESGHILCFSIMQNGILDSKNARNFQDKLCEIIYMFR